MSRFEILQGDCLDVMDLCIADDSVQTCITSPPYFGLRDYGVAGQLGLENTPAEYVAKMVEVFRGVRRVLRDDGTLRLNLGDSYMPENRGENAKPRKDYPAGMQAAHMHADQPTRKSQIQAMKAAGFKRKDLLGIPWRVALALQADGWYLRQDIVWHKPNPMTESVRDRCTKAHEYIFLLSKSERYYFDNVAIGEPLAESSVKRLAQPTLGQQQGSDRVPGKTNGRMKVVYKGSLNGKDNSDSVPLRERVLLRGEPDGADLKAVKRNRRSVWTVTTKPFKGAHFATFPIDLIDPCVLAGSKPGDLVSDPFGGGGTTALAALKHGRDAVLCELNPEYIEIARARIEAATK